MSLVVFWIVAGGMRVDVEGFEVVAVDDPADGLVGVVAPIGFHALFAVEGSELGVGHASGEGFLGLNVSLDLHSLQALLFAFHQFVQSSLLDLFHLHPVVDRGWGLVARASSIGALLNLVAVIPVARNGVLLVRSAHCSPGLFLFIPITSPSNLFPIRSLVLPM